jgi:Mor family transcriptional regulator
VSSDSTIYGRGAEVLADVQHAAASAARAHHLDPAAAAAVAAAVAAKLRERWSGRLVYIPLGSDQDTAARDTAIWADYSQRTARGCTPADHRAIVRSIARSQRLHERTVYRIIAARRAARRPPA